MTYVNTAAFSTRYQSDSANDQPVIDDGFDVVRTEIPAVGGVKQMVVRPHRGLSGGHGGHGGGGHGGGHNVSGFRRSGFAWSPWSDDPWYDAPLLVDDAVSMDYDPIDGNPVLSQGGRCAFLPRVFPLLKRADGSVFDANVADSSDALREQYAAFMPYLTEGAVPPGFAQWVAAPKALSGLGDLDARIARELNWNRARDVYAHSRDFSGLGHWGGGFKSITNVVNKVVQAAVKVPLKVVTAVAAPVVGLIAGKPKQATADDGTPLYQDENGKTITKDQYDALMAQYNQQTLTAAVAPVTPTSATPATPTADASTTKPAAPVIAPAGSAMQAPASPSGGGGGGAGSGPDAGGSIDFGRAGSYSDPGTYSDADAYTQTPQLTSDDNVDEYGMPVPMEGVGGFFDFFSNATREIKKVVSQTKENVKDAGKVAKTLLPGTPPLPDMGLPPDTTQPPSAPIIREPRTDNTAMWVGGGVAVLAVTGLMVYLATRKRKKSR